jgi:hypothetical protein
MSNEQQRFARYFQSRALTIELPPGDTSALTARAVSRRRRRRTALSGAAALALVAGAITVQQVGGDDGAEVAARADAVSAAAPLQWTPVTPAAGLVYSPSSTVTEDGTQYGLSTAPGRYDPDATDWRQTLYRSDDGVEWSAIELPSSLWPSQLASAGNDVYAVGTSPAAGGSRSVVLAHGDAGRDWITSALPIDVPAIEQSIGTGVAVQGLDVSTGPSGVVVAFQLQARADAMDFVPDGVAGAFSASWTSSGLDVYGAPEGCEVVDGGDLDCRGADRTTPKAAALEPIASFTFDQLGIDEALRSMIIGEPHVFVSTDGTSFDEAALPDDVRGSTMLISSDTGYVLFTTTWDRAGSVVTTLRSADARTWTLDEGLSTQGSVIAAGTLDGQAAVVVAPDRSGAVLEVQQQDGTWLPVDLGAAVEAEGVPAGAYLSVSAADIGPLGAAAVITAYDDVTQAAQHYVVHSPDGRSLSVQPLTDLTAAAGYPAAVRVSADAVTIVFADDRPDDGVATSTLLVGTPG